MQITESEFKKLKGAKINKVIKALESMGYNQSRSNGSHMIFTANNMPTLSIPNHSEFAPGTWRNIEKLIFGMK